MPIRFYCPLGHRLVVPDERAGKKGRCPQCHQKVYVPVANPRPSGRLQEREAGEPFALEQADGAQPEILDPPAAIASGGAQARGGLSARKEPAKERPSPADSNVADSKDPIAMALDEISVMQMNVVQPMIYMHPQKDLEDNPGSISNLLPPKPPRAETGAAPAQAATAVPTAAVPTAAVPTAAAPPAVTAGPVNPPANEVRRPQPSPAVAAAPTAANPMASTPAPQLARMPAAAASSTLPKRGWIRAADDDEIDRAYRPDDSQLQVLYFLAGAMLLVALVSGWPALTHFRAQHASGWVAAVLLMSAADLVYIVWLLSLTDWSTLRVGMMLCAANAAAYACGLTMVEGTPDSEPIALGLSDVRSGAGLWCALQMGLLSGMCYGFGRQASLWRDEARDMGPM